MLKSDLVNVLIEQRKISQKQAEQAVEVIFEAMKNALIAGTNIEIRGLGAFHVKSYKGYVGRNPKTSEAIEVRPKRGILFRTGKDLRERVNRAVGGGAGARGAGAAPAERVTLAGEREESAA